MTTAYVHQADGEVWEVRASEFEAQRQHDLAERSAAARIFCALMAQPDNVGAGETERKRIAKEAKALTEEFFR